MLVLSQDDVRNLLSVPEAIEEVEKAFIAVAQRKVRIPERHHIPVAAKGADMLVMSGSIGEDEKLGVKIVSLFPSNPSRGMPSTLGAMMLVDNTDGTIAAVMDATYLTALRTGAASAVATRALANPRSSVLGIIGAGSIAAAQAMAVLEVRPINRVIIFDILQDRACRLAEDLARAASPAGRTIEALAVSSTEEVCRQSHVICTCTTTTSPVVRAQWLSPGAHVNSVGSFSPAMQEVDEEFVLGCSVLAVDSKPAALRPGDLGRPLAKGLLTEDRIVEIGSVLAGAAGGRKSERDATFFKSVGVAAQDVLCGWRVLEKARAGNAGVGVRL